MSLDNKLSPLRISRASLLLCVDVATDCYLGYHLALTEHACQQDMLALIHNITRKWEPLELTTPGLAYAPGACFPSAIFSRITFGKVCLDNAMMHFAKSVRFTICHHLGSTLSLGRPATPKTRNWVEYGFNRLNKVTHRFPSTTGSSPVDSVKESTKNYKNLPVITLHTLEEVLSMVLTEHNIIPQSRLGGVTPLSLLINQMNHHYSRLMPESYGEDWSPFEEEVKCLVHYNLEEHRAPYINFKSQRYQNSCLSNETIIGKQIKIKFDRRDIRSVKAYTLTGEFLGVLYAPKSWQAFSHSVRTRQYINKHVRHFRRFSTDLLSAYFNEVLENRNTPKGAMEVIRVYREFTQGEVAVKLRGSTSQLDRNKKVDTAGNKNTQSDIEILPWDNSWVNQER